MRSRRTLSMRGTRLTAAVARADQCGGDVVRIARGSDAGRTAGRGRSLSLRTVAGESRCPEQTSDRGVALGERSQTEAVLDGRQDGGGVVLRGVDAERVLEHRRYEQRGDAGPRAPLVGDAADPVRRSDVIPLAAELVIGNDHQGVRSVRASLNRI